jgi:hypothetical protein
MRKNEEKKGRKPGGNTKAEKITEKTKPEEDGEE